MVFQARLGRLAVGQHSPGWAGLAGRRQPGSKLRRSKRQASTALEQCRVHAGMRRPRPDRMSSATTPLCPSRTA